MIEPDRPDLDELASAYVDNELTANERADTERDGGVMARVGVFRFIQAQVNGPIQVDDSVRQRLLTTAVAEFQPTPMRRGLSRRPFLMIAGAAAAVLLAVLALTQLGGSSQKLTSTAAIDTAARSAAEVTPNAKSPAPGPVGVGPAAATAPGVAALGSAQSAASDVVGVGPPATAAPAGSGSGPGTVAFATADGPTYNLPDLGQANSSDELLAVLHSSARLAIPVNPTPSLNAATSTIAPTVSSAGSKATDGCSSQGVPIGVISWRGQRALLVVDTSSLPRYRVLDSHCGVLNEVSSG